MQLPCVTLMAITWGAIAFVCNTAAAFTTVSRTPRCVPNVSLRQTSSTARHAVWLGGGRGKDAGSMDLWRGMSTKRSPMLMPDATPMVPYKSPKSPYAQFIDLNTAMFMNRIVMISGFIDDSAANNIISTILYLRNDKPEGEITMYFMIPGANLRPSLAVYDVICDTKEDCKITTVNLGLCTGMGAFLVGAGTKGRRGALSNARFLLHRTGMEEPFQGQASDIALEVSNVKTWNDRMEQELSRMTNQPLEKVQQDLKRDFYLSADEAVRYGLIDKVLLPAPAKRATTGRNPGADLGAFEGSDQQRYQTDKNSKTGGWGGGWKDERGGKEGDDDDDGPPIQKGG